MGSRSFTCAAAPLALVSAIAALGGCASPTPTELALEREAALNERAEQRVSHRQEQQRQIVGTLPDWVIHKPSLDASGVYGVGIGTSHNLSTALQKAALDARRDLAQTVQQELSVEATLAGVRDSEFTTIANAFTARVNVAGVEDVERIVQVGREGFRIYTLLRLPYPEFNRALAEFSRRDSPGTTTLQAQYEQLMQRVSDVHTPAFEATGSTASTVVLDMPDEALVRAVQEGSRYER